MMFKRDEGFTLIELLVVVLIIGILIAIAIPVFTAAKANAERRSCFANERTVEGSAHAYEASYGVLPGAGDDEAVLLAELVPTYLATPPVCPGATTKDFATNYQWSFANGTLKCVSAGSTGTPHGHYN